MIVLFIVLNIWDYLVQVAHDIPLLTLLLGGFFLIVFYVFGTRVRANLIAQNHRFREIGIVILWLVMLAYVVFLIALIFAADSPILRALGWRH